MAVTFDCPKCGAPIDLAEIGVENDATVECRYCGKTVIVPPELRRQPDPLVMQTVQVAHPRPPARQNLALGCVVLIILIGAAGMIFAITARSDPKKSLASVDKIISAPTATDAFGAIETQIAPIKAQVTQVLQDIQTKIPRVTPTPADTATPKPNLTATAALLEATQAAISQQIAAQRGWPVLLEEKFSNASLGWTTGINNNNLALEEMSLAGGKYTWKFTTKKPMASFSFPTMTALTDLYISVDIQMTSDTGNAEDQAGITFRQSTADQTFYFFAVNPEGSYSLSLYDGSGWDILIPTSETSLLKSSQANQIGVSMEGSQILLEINGKVVDSVEDARFTTGIAGVGLHLPAPGEDATVIFSNFSVRAPKK